MHVYRIKAGDDRENLLRSPVVNEVDATKKCEGQNSSDLDEENSKLRSVSWYRSRSTVARTAPDHHQRRLLSAGSTS